MISSVEQLLMPAAAANVGDRVDQIDTPALVVDLDAMERNIQRMGEFAQKHHVRWRVDARTHKCAALALQLQAAGASGAAVQKLSGALALAAAGVKNIFISSEIIATGKLPRLAVLAAKLTASGGSLAVVVDSLSGLTRLAEALRAMPSAQVRVFVEVDTGQGRCGVTSPEQALELVQQIQPNPQLLFGGLYAAHGAAQHLVSVAARREAASTGVEIITNICAFLSANNIMIPVITGSGTGTLLYEAASGIYSELQAGAFLFMDAQYARNERDSAQPPFEHALYVKTQIISRGMSHAVCDAGLKSVAMDAGVPMVISDLEANALEYTCAGDEHGVITAVHRGGALPDVGQMLWLIPGHCDTTVNLYDNMVGVRGGLMTGHVEKILSVDIRGCCR